jgi:hypothetical protein
MTPTRTCRRSCRVVAVSIALCVSAGVAAARPTHRLEQRPSVENSITRPVHNTLALSGPRRTSLSTGANPRCTTITRRRTSKPLRALTTGDNPRGVAIISKPRPATPGETTIYQQLLAEAGHQGLMHVLSTGEYPAPHASRVRDPS